METEPLVAHVKFDLDGNRIQLPKHFTDRLVWVTGSERVPAWLWTISPGRYRLLSDQQVEAEPDLEILRSFMFPQQLIPSSRPTSAKSCEEAAAAVALLFPTQLKFHKSYWRLSFPDELIEFIPPDCEQKKFSILISLEGYVEIWYTQTLRSCVFSSVKLQP